MDTYVYIDGFNLYYGAVRNTPFKWLDLYALCTNIFPQNNILKIKYFTARVHPLGDHNRPYRQKSYIQALQAHLQNKIEIIYGRFRTDSFKYPIAKVQDKIRKNTATYERIWVIKIEEKGSDVNLAVHLLNDCCKDCYKAAIIISNDTDLIEAIKIVCNEYSKDIGLINPYKNKKPCRPLNIYASFHGRITTKLLKKCQLPDTIPGTSIHKPREWN